MSTSSRSDTTEDSFYELQELIYIEEFRREKDLLKETQSPNFDLIKRLELHVRKLNKARSEDKKQIRELENELNSCHLEIDYWEGRYNASNADLNYFAECVERLEVDIEILQEEVVNVREELKKSRLHIEKLEESIASSALNYQCEIESLRLEIMALEQNSLESNKSEYCQEKVGLLTSLSDYQAQFEAAQNKIKYLENENKRVRDMLDVHAEEARLFCHRVEEHFKGWMDCSKPVKSHVLSNTGAGEVSTCGDILRRLLSKLLRIGTSVEGLKRSGSAKNMSLEPHEYKELVKQLKEELRTEKLKAKEEAEDLAQEMAELRYQMTELLEEERKRRACIEQASLQRISELEAQLLLEQRKTVGPVQRLH